MTDKEIEEKLKNEVKTLDIFPSNMTAFEVFKDLPISKTVGISRDYYDGFKRTEIEAVMNMHDIPIAKRKKILDKLGVMEVEVVKLLNKASK